MSVFEYIPLMKEMNSVTAIVGVVILIVFLLIVIFKMLGGIRRGFWRQLVRTSRFIAAGVLSYVIAASISGGIIGMFNENTFNDLLLSAEEMGVPIPDALRTVISCFNPETFEYLLLLPATVIIVPLVFTLLFIVINNILKIVSAIINKILGFKKANSSPSRLGGAVLAGIEAILLFIILLLPITGVLSLVDDAYEVVFESQENQEDEAIVEQYETIFMPFTHNPAIQFTGKLGANALSQSFATVNIDGKKADVRQDILEIIHIALVDGPALQGADFNNLTDENKAAIDSIIESIEESQFMSNLFVGFIQGAGRALGSGILPVEFGEFDDVLEGVVSYLSSFSADTLGEDLDTIKNLYFAISDGGILSAIKEGNSDIMALLEEKREAGDDVVSNIIEVLKGNSRTNLLLTAMTKALISNIIPEDATITVDGVEVEVSYDTVKDSMNEVLSVKKEDFATEEEYEEELKSTLNNALTDNGITLEPEVLDGIADHIDENYSDFAGEELTDEQFNDILLEYYDAYLNYVNGGTVPDNIPEFN